MVRYYVPILCALNVYMQLPHWTWSESGAKMTSH